MSYILDALKKSDQQRSQGDVPGLQTVHLSAINEVQSNKWLYIVIAILLISLAFLVGMYQPWLNPEVLQKINTENTIAKNITPKEITYQKKNDAEPPQIIKKEETENKKPVKIKTKLSVSKINNKKDKLVYKTELNAIELRKISRLSELSSLIQQAVPDMVFAGHVYSSNPVQRSIIINGYSMSEGDVVMNGLKIKQITADGVIFDYQGQLFRKEILQDWAFD